MALVPILAIMVNIALIQGKTEVVPESAIRANSHTHLDVYASAIAKAHYNPWFCNYFKEPGYKCNDCSTALHCFPGNFALLIQCSGQMPYCRNGYCSDTKADRCNTDVNKIKSNANDQSTKEDIVTSSSSHIVQA